MLNWLKKKTKLPFQSNYINFLRRHNHTEMFLTEQNMFNPQENLITNLKIFVYKENGEEYSLDLPQDMTLGNILKMSIGHFYNLYEAVGEEQSIFKQSYRLVLARDMRTLDNDKSIAAEELLNDDNLLLIKCRNKFVKSKAKKSIEVGPEQISIATANILPKNQFREANPINTNLDFKIAFRQILLTMIEASIHLISSEENAVDIFVLVFEHLEKRHKPRVDKNSLKQLTDMGFTEARAIRALQLKRSMVDATEWLLDDSVRKQSIGPDEDNDILLLTPDERKRYFMSDNDPALKVMREFNSYVAKWFIPDGKALQNLISYGYGEDLAKEALRTWCNNEAIAKEFLDGNSKLIETAQKGFDRGSPIMSAILDSPIVQVALSKPKTLFALMVLCETPNNVNVWLSDPETHPVVSQILRIYHAEKHRLGQEYVPAEESSFQTFLEEPGPTSPMTFQEDVMDDLSLDVINNIAVEDFLNLNDETPMTSDDGLPLSIINKSIANIPSMPQVSDYSIFLQF